jgi:hypothetical protein
MYAQPQHTCSGCAIRQNCSIVAMSMSNVFYSTIHASLSIGIASFQHKLETGGNIERENVKLLSLIYYFNTHTH